MNAELPPFKNGEHNSENASTIDRVMTPSIWVATLRNVKKESQLILSHVEDCQSRVMWSDVVWFGLK